MWGHKMSILTSKMYQEDIEKATQVLLPWDKLQNKTILITGATGMIASVIIDILMKKITDDNLHVKIIAMSRNEQKARERFAPYLEDAHFSYISQDITKPIQELGKVDFLLHAASNTHPRAYATDPIGTITANVQGTYELLEYASTHVCERFLCFSSVEIYGENRNDVDKFDESYLGYIDCNTIRAGYPESKRLSETLCNAFAAQKGQDFVIGRYSRVYGPTMGREDSKAIAQFIRKAVNEEDIVLKSEGSQLYSYTYVVDAAIATFYLLLCAENGSAMNVADVHSDIMLKDLADILAKEAGKEVIFELPDGVEKAGYSTATKAVLDATRIEKLGWKPMTGIEEGLRKTVQILSLNFLDN